MFFVVLAVDAVVMLGLRLANLLPRFWKTRYNPLAPTDAAYERRCGETF